MHNLIKLLVIAVVISGIIVTERSVSPRAGDQTALPSPVAEVAPPAGVPLPAFATGFSVFVGEEANDADYPALIAEVLDRLTALNVNSVALVYSVFQDGPDGSVVSIDQIRTPTDDGLTLFIRGAHKRGMSVTLRPTLDEKNLQSEERWRGQITPSDVDQWFATYGDVMVRYAELAQAEEIAALSVGVEFESMEQYSAQWRALIDRVRAVYDGKVTYSYNFQVQDLGFVDALDFVSLDAYYPLDVSSGATVDDINVAWQPWIPVMKQLQDTTGKPVMLAEIGVRSQTNAFREPWKGHDGEQPSQQDQANYYASTCNVISNAMTGANGATVRAEPNAASATVEQVAASTIVRLVGEPVEQHGAVWQHVQTAAGATGWALTDELGGRAVFAGAYVWFATIGSLDYDPATNDDYPVFDKLAEPIIGECFGARGAVALGSATPVASYAARRRAVSPALSDRKSAAAD